MLWRDVSSRTGTLVPKVWLLTTIVAITKQFACRRCPVIRYMIFSFPDRHETTFASI